MTTSGLDPDPPDPGARVDVEAIRARAEAATPGPLIVEKRAHERSSVHYWIRTRDPLPRTDGAGPDVPRSIAWMTGSLGEASARPPSEYRDDPQIEADAAFFAHARADVPALCDEVERLDCALAGEELATARARAHASAWKALAKAKSGIVAALMAGRKPTAAEQDAVDLAACGLRSLGIDPEAP